MAGENETGTDPGQEPPDSGEPDVDDLDDDGDTGDGDGGDDGQDGDDGGFKPPTQEEWEKVQRALTRRKGEKDKLRASLDAANAKLAELSKPPAGKPADQDAGAGDAPNAETLKQQELAEAARKWQLNAAKASAATQLQAAGFSGTAKAAARLTAMLDVAAAEPDEDGVFDFEEAIDGLKDDYPQLFAREAEPPARVPRPTTADRGRQTGKDATQDPTARTSAKLMRQAGLRSR